MYGYGMKGKMGCGCCGNYRSRRVTGISRQSNGMRCASRAAKKSYRQKLKRQLKEGLFRPS